MFCDEYSEKFYKGFPFLLLFMKVIIVTGSVGAGKTTLSRKLAKKLGFKYIDVNRLIVKEKISSGYDRKRKCKIIDIKKLNKSLIESINSYKESINKETNKKLIRIKSMVNKTIINKSLNKKIIKNNKKGIIIDSHLSHYLPRKYVDLCIVAKCGLKELNKRLKKRGYGKGKVEENVECEIFDVCLNEAKEAKHRIMVIDTTKGINISKISKRVI